LHRGEIDEMGALYVEHLDRVAAAVAAAGGTPAQQMAAYLQCVGLPGPVQRERIAQHLPAEVVTLVKALSRDRWERAEQFVDRVMACAGALPVLLADIGDICRPDPVDVVGDHRRRNLLNEMRRLRAAINRRANPEAGSEEDASAEDRLDAAIAALSGGESDRRTAAIRLGRLGDPRAGGPLIAALLDLDSTGVDWRRGDAIAVREAISRLASNPSALSDPAWVDQLVELCRSPSDALRAIAIHGLALTGDAAHQPLMIAALTDLHPGVVAAAVDGLDTTTADHVFDSLVAMLASEGREMVWVRRAAARKLAATDRPERVAILAAALGTLSAGDNGTAHEIAHALVRAGDRSVIATLTGQITAHVSCRHAAAFVLGEFRAREAVGAISEALRNAGRWDLLRAVACAEALGKIGSPQAVPALIAAVDQPSADVRDHALRAMARIGGRRSRARPSAQPTTEIRSCGSVPRACWPSGAVQRPSAGWPRCATARTPAWPCPGWPGSRMKVWLRHCSRR